MCILRKTPLFSFLAAALLSLPLLSACSGASTSPIGEPAPDSGTFARDSGVTMVPPDSSTSDSTVPPADSSVADSAVSPDTATTPPDSGKPVDSAVDGTLPDAIAQDSSLGCLGVGGTDCSLTAQVCNPATNMCVDCLTNTDCAGNFLGTLCDPASNTCVQCLSASDCPYDTPGCTQGFCGSCATAADCPPNDQCPAGACTCSGNNGCGGDAPTCILTGGNTEGSCGCTADPQCPNGQRCDTTNGNGVCFQPCTSAAGACDPNSGQPYCQPSTGQCVQCLTDGQCAAAQDGLPYCSSTSTCVQCTTDSQCLALGTGLPFCIDSSCAGCRTYMDCPATTPGCDSFLLTCGTCEGDSDCPPGSTCPAGTCQITDAGAGDAATDANGHD